MSKSLGSLLTVLLVACAPKTPSSALATSTEQPEAALRPTTVVLVRHAEKDTSVPDDPDPPLTDAGVERARCLANMLEDAPVTHLVATDFQRTRATLEPLAEQEGIAVHAVKAPDLNAALLDATRSLPPGSFAVVASHSNLIPEFVEALGGTLKNLDERGFVPGYDRLVMIQWLDDEPTIIPFRYCAPTPS